MTSINYFDLITEITEKNLLIERVQKEHGELLKILIVSLQSCFDKAIVKYAGLMEKEKSFKFQVIGGKIDFDVFTKFVSIKLRLINPQRKEPYKDLVYSDLEEIRRIFRSLVEKELREANIPMTLYEISIPSKYYAK